MISRFRVQNYKALRDVTLDLTPIHVLIGPNDTGKTSILEAIAALCRTQDTEPPQGAFSGRWEGLQLAWNGDKGDTVEFRSTLDESNLTYTLGCRFSPAGRKVNVETERIDSGDGGTVFMHSFRELGGGRLWREHPKAQRSGRDLERSFVRRSPASGCTGGSQDCSHYQWRRTHIVRLKWSRRVSD